MRLLVFIVLFSSSVVSAQVVNIESLRRPSDSTNWIGSASLDISLIKNTSDIIRIAHKAHVQYNDTINFWLFVNDLNFQKVEENSLVNRGTQHLRYNRRIASILKWEAFAQAQYDAISEIDFRGLLGTGPRFKLSTTNDYKFYLGTLAMYEYEEASASVGNIIERDWRLSAYLSFSLYPTQTISIISTSYYQPRLDNFSDYRLSSNTSLLFQILKNLAFKVNFNFFYDEFPVSENVPNTQYELTNGILYTF
ncbi:hypothetical protein GCM10009117_14990 [Gangjinia marincola]|uniref:DUF481 domain-containing protein n=1 Tax=Gangjinia marincola TaxID=578463 RepID=A0ABP3XT10_9FLAO